MLTILILQPNELRLQKKLKVLGVVIYKIRLSHSQFSIQIKNSYGKIVHYYFGLINLQNLCKGCHMNNSS